MTHSDHSDHSDRTARTARTAHRRRRPGILTVGAVVGALAAVTLLAAACGKDDAKATTTTQKPADKSTATTAAGGGLAGTSWSLATYSAAAGSTPAVTGADAVLDFAAAGRVSGSTGCNRFNGTWTEGTQAGSLTVKLGPMTMMACTSAELTAQEQAVMRNLADITAYAVKGSTLSLTDKDGNELLTYTAVSGELKGTNWTANGVNNGKTAVVGVADTAKLTASFGADGQLTGFGGCNNFTATYSTDGSKISITALAGTKKTCGTETDQLEQQYFTALQNSATYEVSGSTLNVRDSAGATQVNFSRAQ